jgi:hypothetical protein
MAQPVYYSICIKGELDPTWTEWFEGLEVSTTGNGQTVISGPLQDQAALSGLLARLSGMNLTIISVNRCEADETVHEVDQNSDF